MTVKNTVHDRINDLQSRLERVILDAGLGDRLKAGLNDGWSDDRSLRD